MTTRRTSREVAWRGVAHLAARARLGGAAAIVVALGLAACTGSPSAPGPSGGSSSGTPLAGLADAAGLELGFALDPVRLDEPDYRAVAEREFDLVVAENAMKWNATEPEQGQFTFTAGDLVAEFAAQQGAALHGHTLLWHQALPDWVRDLAEAGDAVALSAAMDAHIAGVVGHYAGRVESWDVVNEAFDDDGTRRDTPFQAVLGDGYVAEAFRAAHAADPDALLCYNDYGIEGIGPKSDAVLAMVEDLLAQGVSIGCVGFQGHLVVGAVPDDLAENLQRFVDAGVQVRISELDVRVPVPASDDDLARQAADYRAVVEACLAVEGCTGVTTWGLTDRYSWVPAFFPGYGAALLFDEQYAPKPAYDEVAAALGARP
jgi:endo-1,4-beta-xylanase